MKVFVFICILNVVRAGPPPSEASFKGQFCTDPRTMRKHAAYTEWADAYSCTRHRCQPGGRNLAIYTVGCKRVEAPESAIECEEVVEDTNMQFPYCCTRLRCLVVVRGEVWTRVLGQPWETLPAAPWSHMYKMKKPPPGAEESFLPKINAGPVYELTEPDRRTTSGDKVLRAKDKGSDQECDHPVARTAAASPDIVIALSTNIDKQSPVSRKVDDTPIKHKRGKSLPSVQLSPAAEKANYFEDETADHAEDFRTEDADKPAEEKDNVADPGSEEQYFGNKFGPTDKPPKQRHQQVAWTEIPQDQWNNELAMDGDNAVPKSSWNDHQRELDSPRASPESTKVTPSQTWESYHQPDVPVSKVKKESKPANLQALVDAIGSRMRDIESVVARMSEKVQKAQTPPTDLADFVSGEKAENGAPPAKEQDTKASEERQPPPTLNRAKDEDANYHDQEMKEDSPKPKKSNPDADYYKRFSSRSRSKYIRSMDATTEPPLFVGDTHLNGYFSDASNAVKRNPPKEPAATYMAPVLDTRRNPPAPQEESEETEKKHKKKSHKKKKSKGHHKKHRSKDDKRRKFKLNSVEVEKNAVSLEDSSTAVANE